MVFVLEVSNHFFNVVDMVNKTVNIIHFFPRLCSRSVSSNSGANGYFISVFCSIKMA